MSGADTGWRRWRRIWSRDASGDVDAELRFHFEERITALIEAGETEPAARARAMAEFGDLGAVRANLLSIDHGITGRSGRREWWGGVRDDLRYVTRSLGRSPGFVAAVALTLALGLGANAAIFSLLDRLFVAPQSGIVAPSGIHRIYEYEPPKPGAPAQSASHPRDVQSVFAYPQYREIMERIPAGTTLAGYHSGVAAYGVGDAAPRLVVSYVLGDYFTLLGAHPVAGRFFAPEELRVETPRALVVISARLWKVQFGNNPDVVGQSIEIDGHRHLVIGVAAAPFHGPDNDAVDVWVPFNTIQGFEPSDRPWYQSSNTFNIRLLVRTTGAAQLAAVAHAAELVFKQGSVFPDSLAQARIGGVVEPVMPGFDRSRVNIATRLAGVSLIILLIACANVGNLLLTRGMRRSREIAVRLSLGVSRARLFRLLLLEAVVLALAGGAIAVVVAFWGAGALRHLLLPTTRWWGPPLDIRIIAFTVTLAVVAGLASSVFPAVQASRPDLVSALKTGARHGGHRRSRLRNVLLMAQAALSVVLLAGAGLFLHSLRSVESERIGYDGDRLIFAEVNWSDEHADHSADVTSHFQEYLAQLGRLPGVERVAYDNIAPFRGMQFMQIHLPGRDSVPGLPGADPTTQPVSASYFGAVGIRVVRGRGFDDRDKAGAPPVVIVSQLTARTFWPGQDAVGQCVILGKPGGPCRTVVGVVSDVHMHDIVESGLAMQLYIPKAQDAEPNQGVAILRARAGMTSKLIPLIRQATIAMYGSWALPRVHAMSEYLDMQLQPWRLAAVLFSAAGALALLVAMVGIYSTISSVFSQRIHEIGVRIALGALAGNIVRLVLGEGIRIVAIGIVIGVALALAAGQLVQAMLYRTSPRDPLILAGVATALLGVAACACLIPAWRAMRVDPVTALRAD